MSNIPVDNDELDPVAALFLILLAVAVFGAALVVVFG